MDAITITSSLAGIFMAICQFPQVVKVVRTRNTDGLSLFMQIILSLGVFFWLVTGVLCDNLPMVLSNAFCFVLSLIIIGYIVRNKMKK